ncbi:putative Predicted hydrolase or acyltransferase alpha/beta hydrolase fold protein [Candidatus Terasakiella magnetica]|uniref:Putative Predicted hydrolase or acyltransferase alpha/beta hydrolase fold protein n=1 Tax=Candidatus Terasakiella magnetica TaxID=1867952 RepID=A0A1C3RF55_9PROT|nr:alpha/beta hydrolase [Candidatus Terasakiella magnetica]SCA55844.1 putative Predicted hydrolase or acyltransferase alpha/beta hydrolase fold protein [Candidatus Terasakiella magnetica]
MKTIFQDITLHSQTMRAKHLILCEEKSDRPTLVFLHEGLGCLELWKDFPEKLCQETGLNGFVYERIGFGKSSPLGLVPRPIDYLEREGRDVLPAVLKQANIERPLLVGHSDGGSIALIYAAFHPNKLVSAITEAAHVFVEDVTLLGIRKAGELYFDGALKPKLERYHGGNTDKAFRGWHDTWLTPEFAKWNMEKLLPHITCPLLVIQGINDEYGTQHQVQSIVENSSGPATPFMVPDCAHIPHFQSQDLVLQSMVNFIAKLA